MRSEETRIGKRVRGRTDDHTTNCYLRVASGVAVAVTKVGTNGRAGVYRLSTFALPGKGYRG